jgi:hypothetical protein
MSHAHDDADAAAAAADDGAVGFATSPARSVGLKEKLNPRPDVSAAHC